MRRGVRILGLLVLLAIFAGAYAVYRLSQPYRGFSDAVFVDLPRGISTYSMATRLASAGVVRSRWDFLAARLEARLREQARPLKAGEYRFDRAATASEVAARIARGDTFFYSLVVPEGKNMFEIGATAQHLGIFPADKFVEAARDSALIRDLDPDAPSLEGYLYPDTYKIGRHTTPAELCRMMTARFREAWRKAGITAPTHDIVTLASLVEKEGKLPEDRPMIAAVFQHRLKLGMKLECDPTTIYAAELQGRYTGIIHRSDLNSQNPYNTYQHSGLPPGPIANPGMDALNAVLHPAVTDALYFVLRPDGSGGHEFSKDLARHQKAVESYRRGLKRSLR